MTRMYIVWLWYDHNRTMRWIWYIWCDNNMTMALPINDHAMTMTPWSCPSHVMVIRWYLYDHVILSSLLCRDHVISWYGHALVSGHNMVINSYLWSFMSISLPSLVFLKVVLQSLFKIITGSWLIMTRQKQDWGMAKVCSLELCQVIIMVYS